MVERYDYAYKVWHCKIDNKICDLEGQCDRCYWAKIYKQEEALNSQETPIKQEEKK